MSYQPAAPGDWGEMRGSEGVQIGTEFLVTTDGCKLFLRSWVRNADAPVLLILHGLGGHGGWYVDLGNMLSEQGMTIYAMDYRGFGRSEGMSGHIDKYHTYVEDIEFVLSEIRKRHPKANLYLLGHSMGGLFALSVAAEHGKMLSGILLLNIWIQDTSRLSLGTMLKIVLGGMFRSKRYWKVATDTTIMTDNPEARQMLEADIFWRNEQTAAFLFQILLMRLTGLAKAKRVTVPALVMQAEDDKSVVVKTSRTAYERLGSGEKVWKSYPKYCHDSEFEQDHSQLDKDILTWMLERTAS
jgi:alpha-beta hydrolase superfamily lysophospholipase